MRNIREKLGLDRWVTVFPFSAVSGVSRRELLGLIEQDPEGTAG